MRQDGRHSTHARETIWPITFYICSNRQARRVQRARCGAARSAVGYAPAHYGSAPKLAPSRILRVASASYARSQEYHSPSMWCSTCCYALTLYSVGRSKTSVTLFVRSGVLEVSADTTCIGRRGRGEVASRTRDGWAQERDRARAHIVPAGRLVHIKEPELPAEAGTGEGGDGRSGGGGTAR